MIRNRLAGHSRKLQPKHNFSVIAKTYFLARFGKYFGFLQYFHKVSVRHERILTCIPLIITWKMKYLLSGSLDFIINRPFSSFNKGMTISSATVLAISTTVYTAHPIFTAVQIALITAAVVNTKRLPPLICCCFGRKEILYNTSFDSFCILAECSSCSHKLVRLCKVLLWGQQL